MLTSSNWKWAQLISLAFISFGMNQCKSRSNHKSQVLSTDSGEICGGIKMGEFGGENYLILTTKEGQIYELDFSKLPAGVRGRLRREAEHLKDAEPCVQYKNIVHGFVRYVIEVDSIKVKTEFYDWKYDLNVRISCQQDKPDRVVRGYYIYNSTEKGTSAGVLSYDNEGVDRIYAVPMRCIEPENDDGASSAPQGVLDCFQGDLLFMKLITGGHTTSGNNGLRAYAPYKDETGHWADTFTCRRFN